MDVRHWKIMNVGDDNSPLPVAMEGRKDSHNLHETAIE